jgi:hypothetical protein
MMAETTSHAVTWELSGPPENGRASAVLRTIVLIISVEAAGEVPGVTEVAENAQPVSLGSPAAQDSVTTLAKLFTPVTAIW